MIAVILAAGRGLRFRSATEVPKRLLSFGGAALLDRYVASLDALGIGAIVVVGYRGDDVRGRLDATAPRAGVRAVVNPAYELGSIISLARGLDALAEVGGSPDGILLMDGDVLFHPELLIRLASGPHGNALLVDVGTEFTDEEYMAGVDGGRVTALRRGAVPGHEAAGEWVGFARLDPAATGALHRAIRRQIDAGEDRGGYEDALASILGSTDVRCVDASDLPWIEIDFPSDAERAARMLDADSRWPPVAPA